MTLFKKSTKGFCLPGLRKDLTSKSGSFCMAWEDQERLKPLSNSLKIIGKGRYLNLRIFMLVTILELMLETRFWGIFWINASSHATADQGFLEIARLCGVDEDSKVVKQWLSNTQEPWLLIIDNADDPSIDVSESFPTGNRGSILLTSRNPECKLHATVGSCELG